ncbi:hypothetical protein NQ318_018564 [Aromia moschata]|uniref:Uncharacterized protein n=1 Tax=Aromia moschata TaxID=1265417 RepID=A0AAV8ZF03_9CUCU|nr:hypothetical protein NQ318_018564 [Aromia moschata]
MTTQKCTAEAITRVILETLENFQLLTSQVLLFVTDGAATMLSVGRSLKEHEVDALISSTKKVFLKSPKRLRAFHTQCHGVSEPPQPIITRWGTWLVAAFYYDKYFREIKCVLLKFNPKEAAAIKESQMTFQTRLHAAITRLKNTALPLAQSLQIVDDVNTVLQTISD